MTYFCNYMLFYFLELSQPDILSHCSKNAPNRLMVNKTCVTIRLTIEQLR